MADWTFGKRYLYLLMNFLSQIPFLGLISHDHFQQYESQVEKSLNDIGNKNQDIHE